MFNVKVVSGSKDDMQVHQYTIHADDAAEARTWGCKQAAQLGLDSQDLVVSVSKVEQEAALV